MAAILQQLMQDPEIAVLLKDPETQKKLMAFFMSGGTQYADDPVVQKVSEVLQSKVPGAAGAKAGGKGPGGKPPQAKPPTDDDLD